ncbi:MAG: twin-arginine translocase TatA/TatE family subunit [Bacteroidia bacterium]|nr:twin-arginine translocase TatA/TatE family subunit [Bacteroidota bacterium]MBP9789863.1 twin-arginine translocase TatA/TatE family subunit [Bacteroidia bacterium]MBK7431610.1 twin-arginine translocase TatA/TatE family subunit [Bacteroidota bacterium]MBK7572858.1 twin-arginine translocase TatA/TatE family subunit [Bacteroidota bacterium]MBK8584717.1 twin-arginine translocase TatA/TatE family subunit [Bacteroidota bacterium]
MTLLNLLFLNLGGGEIFVILLVVLLFFGSKRIPDLAKGLGKGMREFKDAMSGIENEVRNAASDTPAPAKKQEPPAQIAPESPAQTEYNQQSQPLTQSKTENPAARS